jgi:hypothetical protein
MPRRRARFFGSDIWVFIGADRRRLGNALPDPDPTSERQMLKGISKAKSRCSRRWGATQSRENHSCGYGLWRDNALSTCRNSALSTS